MIHCYRDSLSYRLFLLPLEALCMIIAVHFMCVHLSIVRIFLLQNDTQWSLGQSQLGRTMAAICKKTDITVTYCTCLICLFFSIQLGLCQLILQNET